ncbi:unnamed protein product [Lathyrus oleraceus]
MNQRFRRNSLLGINTVNDWLDKMDDVKREVKNHFEARFQESGYKRPSLVGSSFKCLDDMERDLLEGPFSMEDLKEVIWEGVVDKSRGLNGFNMSFYRAS